MKIHPRWLLIGAAGIVPAFALGYWLAGPDSAEPAEDSAVIEPVVVEAQPDQIVEPVFPELGTGPRPPGVRQWADLRGGECIASFEDGFADTFDVVACEEPHQAEFVRAALIDNRPDSDYPGDEAIRLSAQDNCSMWDLLTLNNPENYDDLLVVPGYSLGEQAWQRGERLMGCFVYREGGQLFVEPLTVP